MYYLNLSLLFLRATSAGDLQGVVKHNFLYPYFFFSYMKILLDTNFILTAVKQKIDFPSKADELFDMKVEFLVPAEVVQELKTLSKRKCFFVLGIFLG